MPLCGTFFVNDIRYDLWRMPCNKTVFYAVFTMMVRHKPDWRRKSQSAQDELPIQCLDHGLCVKIGALRAI